MIPLKLELKNFLSYGSDIQVVDFKNHSLICLSGKNGNGKSALLDAITWVLWGQARKVSGTVKPDEGLLRLGQTRMMVSLEFEFSNDIYRVRREYSKTYGKPLMVLDFEFFDKNKDKFLPLTEKTIRLTQSKIEKLLGIDYQTFINSAFLRQGQADEFSKKTPKERKQILGNILGLSRYSDLMNLALQKVKKLNQDYQLEEKLLENDESNIKKETEFENLIKDEKEKVESFDIELKKTEADLAKINKDKETFLNKKEQYLFLENELKSLKDKINLKLSEFRQFVLSWKKKHCELLKLESKQAIEKDKHNLEEQDKKLFIKQKKSLSLEQEILKQQNLYQKRYNSLDENLKNSNNKLLFEFQKKEFEFEQIINKIKEEEKKQSEILEEKKILNIEIDNLKKTLEQIPEHNKVFEKFKADFEKKRSFYAYLVQKGNWLKNSLKELKEKVDTLSRQESACCPLCEHVLTLKRKEFLSDKFLKDINRIKYLLKRPTKIIEKLKIILFQEHKQLKVLQEKDLYYKKQKLRFEELEKRVTDLSKKIGILNKNVLQLTKNKENKEKELKKEKIFIGKQINKIEKEIKDDQELTKIKNNLNLLKKENNDLKYDEKFHKQIQNKLDSTLKKLKQFESLNQINRQQEDKKIKISLLSSQLKDFKEQKVKLEKSIKDLNFDIKDEKILENQLTKIKSILNKYLDNKNKSQRSLALFEYEIKKIKELKLKSKQRVKKIEELKDELFDYQTISQAFGKNGIQALLIEQAIPQIEEEANYILSRLTENQSQVFIESLRDLKKGGVRETLDIKISDAAGIRSYEMFSGGEAFRVDFALRIAISKLLARRAGIALQTLIIDEGFGSQDEEGLARLMDAIYSIKDDFSKVIVVSHLNSFKDNFPIHFIIQKGTSGSFINVQERG